MADKTFQEMMSDARLALITGNEFLRLGGGTDLSRMTVGALCAALQDLLGVQLPEMSEVPQLEPIDFGPNDKDRVKDMFEKVFLLEYGYSRDKDDGTSDDACRYAQNTAIDATDIYRRWLKEQESE